MKTIDSQLKFRCVDRNSTNLASASGLCLEAKKRGLNTWVNGPWGSGRAVVPYDKTCGACSPDLLEHSIIKFASDAFPPEGSESPGSARPGDYPSVDEFDFAPPLGAVRNWPDFVALVVHELLHFCVGPHGDGRRPDARDLGIVYLKNCGW